MTYVVATLGSTPEKLKSTLEKIERKQPNWSRKKGILLGKGKEKTSRLKTEKQIEFAKKEKKERIVMKYLLMSILLISILYGYLGFEIHIMKGISIRKKIRSILPAQKYNVVIEYEGKEHNLQISSNYNILDAALDAGLELTHDCKLGVCLTCPAKLLSGKVDQSEGTLDQSVIDQGYTLMCIAKPQSDVRIKTISEDELINAQFIRPS